MASDKSLEELLREKLLSGELSQEEYDELYAKFKRLGLLSHRFSQEEVKQTFKSQDTTAKRSQPISVIGRTNFHGDLDCSRLSVVGYAKIDGDLIVRGLASISGRLEVDGDAKFLNKVATSGSITINENLYTLGKFSLTGKADISGEVLTEAPLFVNGRLFTERIRSTSTISMQGNITVLGDILADRFVCEQGKCIVGNNLKAKKIVAFSKLRENYVKPGINLKDLDEIDSIKGVADLTEIVISLVNNIVPSILNTVTSSLSPVGGKLHVQGNIVGEEIDITNTIVEGNVVGRSIILGPNVTVMGTVLYKDTITVVEENDFDIRKADE